MKIFIYSIFLSLLLFSCRSSRKISTIVSPKDSTLVVVNPAESDSAKSVRSTFAKINSRQIQYSTFSSKVKVDYSDDKNTKLDFNAFIRMKKDSAIWVSIIAAFNIEAYRVMITPDSVVILDKINRTIQKKSLSYLQEITKIPFDFKTLEDLLIGNPVYLNNKIVAYREQEDKLSFSTIGEAFKNYLTVSKNDLNILFCKLDDIDISRSRTANLAYEDYIDAGPWKFAQTRKINLAEKNTIDVKLDFKQLEFDKPLAFPFSVPKNYRIK